MTMEELKTLVEEKVKSEKKEYIEEIKRTFDLHSALLDDMLKDPSVSLTKEQKETMSKFKDMDLKFLDAKQIMSAIDSMINFMVNKSTAGIEGVLSTYGGKKSVYEDANAKDSKGRPKYKAKDISTVFLSKLLGRNYLNLFAEFEKLVTNMFVQESKWRHIIKSMGYVDAKKGYVRGIAKKNKYLKEYVDKYFDKKPNNEPFNLQTNKIERAIIAETSRYAEGKKDKEFKDTKSIIDQSIKDLRNGSEEEIKLADKYQEVYDRILKDSNSSEDVIAKSDPINVEAVKYASESIWGKEYDNFYQYMKDVRNEDLGRDKNYSSSRMYKKTKNSKVIDEIEKDDEIGSGFNLMTNTIYDEKAGNFKKATKPSTLKKGLYISLDFEQNLFNSLESALVDMETSRAIRKAKAYISSENFEKIVPNYEDRTILKERLIDTLRDFRGKKISPKDDYKDLVDISAKFSKYGAAQALGSVEQAFGQTIPVALNTLINAGGINLTALTDPSKVKFMNSLGEHGYSISMRGEESHVDNERYEELLKSAAESKGEELKKAIWNLNQFWFKNFLVKGDVGVAKASWFTYYEKGLKKQGEKIPDNYDGHKINEDAADYAESQVNKQQNTSLHKTMGKFFTDKSSGIRIIKNTLFGFANYRIDQHIKMRNDLRVLKDGTSSFEDRIKSARSLGAYTTELAVYKSLAIGFGLAWGSLVNSIMGKDEDDEEWKKRVDKSVQYGVTGIVTDFLSPLPFLDVPILVGVNTLLSLAQTDIPEEEKINLYVPKGKMDYGKEVAKSLGVIGIPLGKALDIGEMVSLGITKKYTDSYGSEKIISDEDADFLLEAAPVAIIGYVGVLPQKEVSRIVSNSVRSAKLGSKTEKQLIEEPITEQKNKNEKRILNQMMKETGDEDEIIAIKNKIKNINNEESAKEYNAKKELEKQKLLGGEYDNMQDMEKYDKDLYDEKFGPNSEWHEKYKLDEEIESEVRKEKQKMKDEEYDYVPESKGNYLAPKSIYNSDGSKKSKSNYLSPKKI
jgi:hypothetical protein